MVFSAELPMASVTVNVTLYNPGTSKVYLPCQFNLLVISLPQVSYAFTPDIMSTAVPLSVVMFDASIRAEAACHGFFESGSVGSQFAQV